MQLAVVTVTVLLLLIASMGLGADIKSYRAHYRKLAKYPCKHPQPRVVELEDLENNQELMEMMGRITRDKIKPAVTVLHRCQSSGCCKSSAERCMPIDTKDVLLTFAVTDDTLKYVHVKEKEHTRCGCVPIQ